VTSQTIDYAQTRIGVVWSGALEFPSGPGGSPVARVELRNESTRGVEFGVFADAPILVGIYRKDSNDLVLGEPDGGMSRKLLNVRLGPNEHTAFIRSVPATRLSSLPPGAYRAVASVTLVGGESLVVELGP